MANENIMKKIGIEKVILSCSGVKEDLDRYVKLLENISDKKPVRKKTVKRIPGFGIRPKMEVGCMVTIRGKKAIALLIKLLAGIENTIKEKQIADNHFSFGIKEYIEIPNQPYDREIGMAGFKTTVVFSRKGKRIARKKSKKGNLPKRHGVKKEEIIKFLEDNFNTLIE